MIYIDVKQLQDGLYNIKDGKIYKYKAKGGTVRAYKLENRPQGKWIIHYRDKWMVRAECPKCHRRFEFSPRAIWKCCPMCETRMKGADYEADNNQFE